MLLQSLAKNAEFTYGVHKDVLAEIVPDNAFTMLPQLALQDALKKLDEGVMGSVRALNHRLELLRQGIAYGLTYKFELSLDQQVRLLFAVYKRNKRNNEGQLSSKLSLGAGGHIEGDDVSYHLIRPENSDAVTTSSAIDMLETLDDSYIREYSEEVSLGNAAGSDLTSAVLGVASSVATGFHRVGFVMDSQPEPGYVGNIHFGVVYVLDASNEVVSFEMREPQNEAIAWASAEDLLNDPLFQNPEAPFEPWSAMIVAQIKELETYILRTFHNIEQYGTVSVTQMLESIAKEAWSKATVDTRISIADAKKKVEELTVDLINEKLGNVLASFRVEVLPLQGQDEKGHYFSVNLTATDVIGESYDVPTKQHLVEIEASEA